MEAIELIELIRCGEDSRTQFKESQDVTNARSLAGEMVAFANSNEEGSCSALTILAQSWALLRATFCGRTGTRTRGHVALTPVAGTVPVPVPRA